MIMVLLTVFMVLLGLAGMTPNHPAPTTPSPTTIALVDDCEEPFVAPVACDGAGPAVGSVTYEQVATGTLEVVVVLDTGVADRTYPVLLAGCGSAEVTSCGTLPIGSLTTDAQGRGSVHLCVETATLQAAPFGAGDQVHRLTLVKPDPVRPRSRPGVLAAGPIAYTIP
jgi:hypothetical protein